MAENIMNGSPLKVLIVDDEQLVRKGLRMTVDWSKHGMVVVDDAANGSLGWQRFLDLGPEIVITDIVMPEMDGIELAQRIRRSCPDTKIMFLSCHRDFAYAQQGIQLGISDYIVKTSMDDDQIDEVLDKVRREMEKARDLKVHQSADAEPKEQTGPLEKWFMLQDRNAGAEVLTHLEGGWSWMADGGGIFHLYTHRAAGGTAGAERAVLQQISESPFLMDGEGRRLVQCPDNSVFLLCSREEAELCEEVLLQLKLAEELLEWRKAGPVNGKEQWMQAVQLLLRLRLIEQETELQSSMHQEDIYQAIDYIKSNLHLDPRAGEIADRIGVSRSYFSTIFKEATGSSLIEFISRQKLIRAQKLLSMTALRSEDIAGKIGINDVKYFSKWFKKYAGVSPGQYRDQTKRRINQI